MHSNYVSPNWGTDVEATKKMATSLYDLRAIGWKGFDALDWVAELLRKYPSIPVLLIATHTNPSSFDRIDELARTMTAEDRHRLRDYIVGKLALQELSCRSAGAGAGSCEARAALHTCVERSFAWE